MTKSEAKRLALSIVVRWLEADTERIGDAISSAVDYDQTDAVKVWDAMAELRNEFRRRSGER